MSEQRSPNLEAMDELEASRFLTGFLSRLDPEEEYDARHDDYTMEMPQSGERIRGRENLLALRQAYPAGVEFEPRRVVARPDLGVGEYTIRYNGSPVYVVAIAELADGKVVRETHYFAEPFEAPAWRARWVEKMDA